ncbi:phosphoribosyltransferase [Nocardia goodfellowii]
MNQIYYPDMAIQKACEALEGIEFDTMVGTGLSGALMIPTLARAMNVDFLLVRKPNDGSHSSYKVEGRLGSKWLFVDDLIVSGDTFQRVYNEVESAAKMQRHTTHLVGAYFYENNINRYRDRDYCVDTYLWELRDKRRDEALCRCPLCV